MGIIKRKKKCLRYFVKEDRWKIIGIGRRFLTVFCGGLRKF